MKPVPEPRLSPIQQEVLQVCASQLPGFTLTGGAALAAFYTMHRATRDLDFVCYEQNALEEIPRRLRQHLTEQGFEIQDLEVSPQFHRMSVKKLDEETIVDLIADPGKPAADPEARTLERASIRVDSAQAILANKFNTLLSRMELRDLIDARAIIQSCDVDVALALKVAAEKDSGFSPATLGWTLENLPIARLAEHYTDVPVSDLEAFRTELISRVMKDALPDDE